MNRRHDRTSRHCNGDFTSSDGARRAISGLTPVGRLTTRWKFAKELVELLPEVLVAPSSPVVATLLGQTRNIPIVFVSISDPIGEGFVASFAHSGGNVTGFTNFESSMTGKWVELLKDVAPDLARVAFLFNPQTATGGGAYFLRPIDVAASTLKVKAIMALVHDDDEIEAAFAALARQ